MIKFQIGGSPCTHWSIAQSKNRETAPSGTGWELFRNVLIACDGFNPDFTLYENNKSAAPAIKDQIIREFQARNPAMQMQYINSALVSAQNRWRFYCHNFGDVPQPEDRGILLRDVLDGAIPYCEKAYTLRASAGTKQGNSNIIRHIESGGRFGYMGVCEPVRIGVMPNGRGEQLDNQSRRIYSTEGKARTLNASTTGGSCDTSSPHTGLYAEPIRIGTIENTAKNQDHDSQQYRVYSPEGKSVTLCGNGGGVGAKTGLYATPVGTTEAEKAHTIKAQYYKSGIANFITNGGFCATGVAEPAYSPSLKPVYRVQNGMIEIKGQLYPIKLPDGYYIIRKLTVTECCRLQTLPDDYCRAVSATQAYKGLGNGWTAEVIIHLLSHALRGVPRDEKLVVLSMYDGIGTGRYCLDKMGFRNVDYYAYEIDKYAMQIAMSNYPDIIQCGDAFQVRGDGWGLGEGRIAV